MRAYVARLTPEPTTLMTAVSRRVESNREATALGRPVHGATFPRVTLWLAAVPWLNWLMGMLMLATEGHRFGNQMLMAIPIVYIAAFYGTLIVTPVLGYLMVRYLRHMPRAAKVWTLAGLFAGVKCYADAASAYSMFL